MERIQQLNTEINIEKIMIINENDNSKTTTIKFKNIDLEIVSTYEYLKSSVKKDGK